MSEFKPNGYFVDKNGQRVEIVDAEARKKVTALTEELKGNGPHQMLVTDVDGSTKWEDRTHYEGFETIIQETTVNTVADENMGGLCVASVSVLAGEGTISVGDSFTVVFNGVSYTCKMSSMGAVGNHSIVIPGVDDTGEPFLIIQDGRLVTVKETEATVAMYRKYVAKLDYKYIGEAIPKYGAIGELTRIEWDGNTDGLASIKVGAYPYYKVSEVVHPFGHLVHALSARSNGTHSVDEKMLGTNCYSLRNAIVVTAAGDCVTHDGFSFNASSTGVYFIKYKWTTGLAWCAFAEFDTRRENGALYLTNPSGVKYAITVDDSGTLSATEAT